MVILLERRGKERTLIVTKSSSKEAKVKNSKKLHLMRMTKRKNGQTTQKILKKNMKKNMKMNRKKV